MNLGSLLSGLSYGELSNLSIGGEGSGEIPEAQRGKLVSYVNQSLNALFSRFILLEKEVVIDAVENITIYYLQRRYARTSPEPTYRKYLQDTEDDPFIEDVIRITAVYSELGERFDLNNPGNPCSLYTPMFDALQIPFPEPGHSYFVIYQARHPVLVPDDLSQEILLPVPLEEALQAHVAHRVYSHMNGQEHTLKAQEHLARYEAICAEAEHKGLVARDPVLTSCKFTMRGWI